MRQDRSPIGDGFRWCLPIGGIGRVPLLQDGVVGLSVYDHRALETHFGAFDAQTGQLKWWTHLYSTAYARAVSDGQRFFAPFGPTRIAALNMANGAVEWVFDTGTRVRSSPVLADGELVLAAGDRVIAVGLGGTLRKEYVSQGVFFFGEPLVVDDLVVVHGSENPTDGVPSNFVYALDRASLAPRWRAPAGIGMVISCDTCGLATDGVQVFAGGFDGVLRSFDNSSGQTVWSTKLRGDLLRSRPVASGKLVYVTSPDCSIAAVEITTGRPVFTEPLYEEGSWGPPCVVHGNVYVHSGPSLFALDAANGAVHREWPIGYHSYTAPVPTPEGDILICGGDPPDCGYLFRISPKQLDGPIGHSWTVFPVSDAGDDSVAEIYVEFDRAMPGVTPLLDARSLGGADAETLRSISPSTFRWRGHVPRQVKHSRWTGVLRLVGDETTYGTLLADFGVADAVPESSQINGITPVTQLNQVFSGPATIEAILGRYGAQLDQEQIKAMGDWIVESHGLDLHHKWRAGSLRIFHGSGHTELPEMADKGVIVPQRR